MGDNMKIIAVLACSLLVLSVTAVPLQLVSQRNGAVTPSSSAGGNSLMPVLGGNGRYVAFASTANNLALTTSNT